MNDLRRLRHAIEPVAASVYFSPEPNKAYAELGLNAFEGYFCSRTAAAGKLNGPVAAALIGFFNEEVVTRAIESGWAKTDPEKVIEARFAGAGAALERLISQPPAGKIIDMLLPAMEVAPIEGRPLFAAWKAVRPPNDPMVKLWWTLDLFREHRGGGHVAATTALGLNPLDSGLLNEAWYGYGRGTYIRTFGWSSEQIDAAAASLTERGLLDENGLTPDGRDLREEVESLTDRSQQSVASALGRSAEILAEMIEPLADQTVAGGGYPFGRQT